MSRAGVGVGVGVGQGRVGAGLGLELRLGDGVEVGLGQVRVRARVRVEVRVTLQIEMPRPPIPTAPLKGELVIRILELPKGQFAAAIAAAIAADCDERDSNTQPSELACDAEGAQIGGPLVRISLQPPPLHHHPSP